MILMVYNRTQLAAIPAHRIIRNFNSDERQNAALKLRNGKNFN